MIGWLVICLSVCLLVLAVNRSVLGGGRSLHGWFTTAASQRHRLLVGSSPARPTTWQTLWTVDEKQHSHSRSLTSSPWPWPWLWPLS